MSGNSLGGSAGDMAGMNAAGGFDGGGGFLNNLFGGGGGTSDFFTSPGSLFGDPFGVGGQGPGDAAMGSLFGEDFYFPTREMDMGGDADLFGGMTSDEFERAIGEAKGHYGEIGDEIPPMASREPGYSNTDDAYFKDTGFSNSDDAYQMGVDDTLAKLGAQSSNTDNAWKIPPVVTPPPGPQRPGRPPEQGPPPFKTSAQNPDEAMELLSMLFGNRGYPPTA